MKTDLKSPQNLGLLRRVALGLIIGSLVIVLAIPLVLFAILLFGIVRILILEWNATVKLLIEILLMAGGTALVWLVYNWLGRVLPRRVKDFLAKYVIALPILLLAAFSFVSITLGFVYLFYRILKLVINAF